MLRQVSNQVTALQIKPECIKRFFQDPFVKYAASYRLSAESIVASFGSHQFQMKDQG